MAERTDISEKAARDYQRYLHAAHAMQTGVAFTMHKEPGETEPKHLRVGVNTAMVDSAAPVKVLVAKGILTYEEFYASLADQMEEEAKSYQERLGPNVTLR